MKKTLLDMVLSKTYRKRESRRKIFFVLKNTHLPLKIITQAASLLQKNEYHNLDHILSATEMGIKIAYAEGYTKEECTEIAFALLLHDAGHQGFMTPIDEKRSAGMIDDNFSEVDFKSMQLEKKSSLKRIQFKIMATVFAHRGQSTNPDARIMQDADLSHIGQGPYYWLWSSMGLLDEFNKLRTPPTTPVEFIREEQQAFLNYLKKCSYPKGSIWLSGGGQYLLNEPDADLETINSWCNDVFIYAYTTRHDNLLISEFTKEIKKINANKIKKVA